MSFAHKVVIVTGFSSGIGRAAALAFAREGTIWLLLLTCQANLLPAAFHCVYCGRDDEHSPAHIVKNTVENFGGIDVLVNAAGMCDRQSDSKRRGTR
jgi:NAD(P)-dependent dehydrogenase (short-subunit alcohol dehydrogenase family)